MQLSNYHSHCIFCDGRSHPEEFIKFAISKGFRAYGFSSHSPLPFETFWNMSKDNMEDYLEEIKRLKEKYSDRIEIYTGLEIDYLNEWYNASIPYFKELPLDYRIGSLHFLTLTYPMREENMMCIDGPTLVFQEYVKKYFDNNISKVVKYYFKTILNMIETGGIDIVGHMDKIYMNAQYCDNFSIKADWYLEPYMEILNAIEAKGIMIEINTKNLLRKNQLYPHKDFLPMILERNIPVMVNSDCHYPDLVNDGRKEAFEILKTAGFKYTREFIKGKWMDIKL